MFDSLLDELEDDVVSNPQEVEELTDKVVDAEEADADLLVDDPDAVVLPDAEIEAEAEVETAGEADDVLAEQVENWSDDPVRMYLTQMGEIPLLKREQEIALAKRIEITRRRFRFKVLEVDGVLQQVVDTLKKVHTGELPFDRTVKVSLTENPSSREASAEIDRPGSWATAISML